MPPPLLFYCQHSVGMGHLTRLLAVTRSLKTRFDVTFVMGGELPPNMFRPPGSDPRTVLLPPVGLDEMGRMVSRDGRQPLLRALAERRRILLETYRAVKPQVLIIELFPFGRRKFLSELEPVLQEARNGGATRPIVCCSLRDILVSRHAALQRDDDSEAARVLEAYFDAVLVHCDPSFARLEESIAPGVQIPVPVYYTGFVHDPNQSVPRRMRTRAGSIIVSAGGGLVGEPLLRKAIEAHALLPTRSRPPLTIIGGPFLPEDAWRRLRALPRGRSDVDMRRSVPNLVWELSQAAGSISQCGYNTAMDLLHSRVPALVVPFGDTVEDEQVKRAKRLELLGALRVLSPADLTAPRLAAEMTSLPAFRPAARTLSLNGAEQAAEVVERLLERGGVSGTRARAHASGSTA